MQASGNNIQVLLDLEINLNNIDKYLAFDINDERQTNKPTYVFKTSRQLLNIADDMNRNGASPLGHECAFFDGKRNRVKRYLTIGSSCISSFALQHDSNCKYMARGMLSAVFRLRTYNAHLHSSNFLKFHETYIQVLHYENYTF